MSGAEEVGSVGEEAWKLWCALSTSGHGTAGPQAPTAGAAHDPSAADTESPHACPTGWCPICQVVGLVREHPEAVARVGASAASFLHSLRDVMTTPEDPR
ncbi:hypothetical protein [Aeromicrobium sp. CF3.5]|uniref:hypothetical protein n=1 Tax=Aeromicrobium sp. CF3.5 TaxID=3373078 RepID=UPI003EE543E2